MLNQINQNTNIGTLVGRVLFSTSAIGKNIAKPMNEYSALVTYSDGSNGTNNKAGAEFNRGLRQFYEVNEHSTPVEEFDVSDIDGAEFIILNQGITSGEPALMTHHRNDNGQLTGKISIMTAAGNQLIYLAVTVHGMIDNGDILVYRTHE